MLLGLWHTFFKHITYTLSSCQAIFACLEPSPIATIPHGGSCSTRRYERHIPPSLHRLLIDSQILRLDRRIRLTSQSDGLRLADVRRVELFVVSVGVGGEAVAEERFTKLVHVSGV